MKQVVGVVWALTLISSVELTAAKTYTKCSDLPRIVIPPQILLFAGPAYYHFTLNPFYKCAREYFTKTANDFLDGSITGFVLKGNDVVQVNMVNISWTNSVVTYCQNGDIANWHILTVKPTFKGIISCIYSCSSDGVKLKEFKCGATTNDPDVINQELEFVEMAANIPPDNEDYKIADAYTDCPKSPTCP